MIREEEPGMTRPLTVDDLTYIGIRGTVLALDRATGREVWRTPLKGSSFTNLVIERGLILAATLGELFALDPFNGRVLWNNPLRGMGYGIVAFASAPSASAAMQQIADEEAAAAAAASSSTTAAT
jgi:outer membrane protein assembly factor BamB